MSKQNDAFFFRTHVPEIRQYGHEDRETVIKELYRKVRQTEKAVKRAKKAAAENGEDYEVDPVDTLTINACNRLAEGGWPLMACYMTPQIRLPDTFFKLQKLRTDLEKKTEKYSLPSQPLAVDLKSLLNPTNVESSASLSKDPLPPLDGDSFDSPEQILKNLQNLEDVKIAMRRHEGPKLFKGAVANNALVLASLWRAGREKLPMTDDLQFLRHGESIYECVTNEPGYSVKIGDKETLKRNPQTYYNDIHGAVVVELCIGDGVKVGETLKHTKARPAYYVGADILSVTDLFHTAGKQLLAAGVPRSKQAMISNDILSKQFKTELIQVLKQIVAEIGSTEKPLLFELRGATFNNLTEEAMRQVLKLARDKEIRKLFPNITFHVSVDNTTDRYTLLNAYNTDSFRPWIVNGARLALQTIDPYINPMNIYPDIDIVESRDAKEPSRIYTNVLLKDCQTGEPGWLKLGKAFMKVGALNGDVIIKPTEDWTRNLFHECGWVEDGTMPYHKGKIRHNMFRLKLAM